MNPTRISELPDDLRILAEIRREQCPLSDKNEDILPKAFLYSQTPERRPFWKLVEDGRFEDIYRLKFNEV